MTDIVNAPTGADVAAFLGQPANTQLVALAGQAVPIVTAMAMGYTRGKGFDGAVMPSDLAAVIVTASARLATNPQQLEREALAQESASYAPIEWNLMERLVLNRYRVKAV